MTPVAALVRAELAEARAHGIDFATAWEAAMAAVPDDAVGRREWLDVLEKTRASWEAAYLRRPRALEWAVVLSDAADEPAAV